MRIPYIADRFDCVHLPRLLRARFCVQRMRPLVRLRTVAAPPKSTVEGGHPDRGSLGVHLVRTSVCVCVCVCVSVRCHRQASENPSVHFQSSKWWPALCNDCPSSPEPLLSSYVLTAARRGLQRACLAALKTGSAHSTSYDLPTSGNTRPHLPQLDPPPPP